MLGQGEFCRARDGSLDKLYLETTVHNPFLLESDFIIHPRSCDIVTWPGGSQLCCSRAVTRTRSQLTCGDAEEVTMPTRLGTGSRL